MEYLQGLEEKESVDMWGPAQVPGKRDRARMVNTARGGVSNIEPLTRVQEETRV